MKETQHSNSNPRAEYEARCECGQLSVGLKSKPIAQLVCHCNDCREVRGGPFTNVVFFAPGGWQVTGNVETKTLQGGSGKPKHYATCPNCQTAVGAEVKVLKGMFGVVAERIVPPFKFHPICHVWTSEKLPEVEIPVGAVAFPKAPPMAPGS